jgi:hypothetical protein
MDSSLYVISVQAAPPVYYVCAGIAARIFSSARVYTRHYVCAGIHCLPMYVCVGTFAHILHPCGHLSAFTSVLAFSACQCTSVWGLLPTYYTRTDICPPLRLCWHSLPANVRLCGDFCPHITSVRTPVRNFHSFTQSPRIPPPTPPFPGLIYSN